VNEKAANTQQKNVEQSSEIVHNEQVQTPSIETNLLLINDDDDDN